MTFPTLSVYVTFGIGPYDGDTGSTTAVAVTPKRIELAYGKTAELDATPPAAAAMVLDNSTRLYDPFNTAGPYYGKLLPGRLVKIAATWSAVSYPVWAGWTEEWPQTYSPPATADITVPMTDALGLVARAELPESVYEQTIRDEPSLFAWYRMGESDVDQMIDSSGNELHGRYYGKPTSQPGLITGSVDTAMGFDPTAEIPQFALATYGNIRDHATNYEVVECWWTGDANPGLPVTAYRMWTIGRGDTGDAAELNHDSTYGLGYLNWESGDHLASAYGYNHLLRNHIVVSNSHGAGTTKMWVNGFSVDPYLTAVPTPGYLYTRTVMGLRVSDAIFATPNSKALVTVDELSIYKVNTHPTTAWVQAHFEAGRAPWLGDTTKARLNRILGYSKLSAYVDPVPHVLSHLWSLGPVSLDLSPVEYLQRLETTEQGRLVTNYDFATGVTLQLLERIPMEKDLPIVAAFTDDPAGTLHYESITLDTGVDRVRNIITVNYPDGQYLDSGPGNMTGPVAGQVKVTDDASVVTYGPRTLEVNSLVGTVQDAQDLAEYLVNRLSVAHVRVTSLTIRPSADTRLWPTALGLKIGDRVSVRRWPQSAGSAFTVDCRVDGIHHVIDNGIDTWETTYLLSSLAYNADGSLSGWWVWGTSAWGDVDMRWYF